MHVDGKAVGVLHTGGAKAVGMLSGEKACREAKDCGG